MKKIFYTALLTIFVCSCRKPQVLQTRSIGDDIPWTDSSIRHPKNTALKNLLDKYRQKGLPGISLLVSDKNGTWAGATGKADIENNIDFVPATISKAASITKFFMSTLVFKLIEDSVHTGLGYGIINTKISHWIPSNIIDKLPNGIFIAKVFMGKRLRQYNGIGFGQCSFWVAGYPAEVEYLRKMLVDKRKVLIAKPVVTNLYHYLAIVHYLRNIQFRKIIPQFRRNSHGDIRIKIDSV